MHWSFGRREVSLCWTEEPWSLIYEFLTEVRNQIWNRRRSRGWRWRGCTWSGRQACPGRSPPPCSGSRSAAGSGRSSESSKLQRWGGYLVAQLDDLCYFCLDFPGVHLYFTPQIQQRNIAEQCTMGKGRIGEDFPAKLYSYTAAGQVGEDFGKIYVGRKVFRVGRIRYSRPAARFLQTMLHLSPRALFSGVDIKTWIIQKFRSLYSRETSPISLGSTDTANEFSSANDSLCAATTAMSFA